MSGIEWNVHYESGRPPWETGQPSAELARALVVERIELCRVIDVGCGSGINAVWLAQQGFDVTGVDFNALAIERARQRAAAAGVTVRFLQADVCDLPGDLGEFPFFFDRGCYHAVRRENAPGYLRTIQQITAPGSVGLVLAGNSKSTHQPGQGPPVVSEAELRAELGSVFEIVRLREFNFDQLEGDGVQYLAWSCLLKRA